MAYLECVNDGILRMGNLASSLFGQSTEWFVSPWSWPTSNPDLEVFSTVLYSPCCDSCAYWRKNRIPL